MKSGLSRRIGSVVAFITIAALAALGSVVGHADAAHAAGDPVATLVVPATIVEGTGGTTSLLATVTLDVPAATTVSLTFATTDGTASSVGDEDFQAQSVTVTFLAGAVGPANLNIPITTDDIDESDETLSMSLTAISAGITVAGSPATTTILDDDDPVVATLSVPSTVFEGTGGATNLTAQITLSRPFAETVSMTFATADGTASSVADEDFQAQSITVTFLAGAVGPANLNIPITPDPLMESNETFSSSVTPISPGITVAGSPATTTILDDDGPLVATLSVPSTVVEGTGGATNLTAQITLNHPAATTLSMTFATTDGTASSVGQEDYQAQSVTVTFLAGAVGPATINIPITADSLSETNETFTSSLTPISAGLTVAGSPATTAILDDDDLIKPTVAIEQASGQGDPTSSSPITFTATFSEPVFGFDGSDVTLTGTAGATTATVTGGPLVYTIGVTGMAHAGTVIAALGAGIAADGHGNTNFASTSVDNTVAFALTKPAGLAATGTVPAPVGLTACALLLLGVLLVVAGRVRRHTRSN